MSDIYKHAKKLVSEKHLAQNGYCAGQAFTLEEFVPGKKIVMPNKTLVECLQFEDDCYAVRTIDGGSGVKITLPDRVPDCAYGRLSVSVISTDDSPYIDFLRTFIDRYKEYDFEICVAFYGETVPDFVEDNCVVWHCTDAFSMAEARNRSLSLVGSKYTFMLDIDCHLDNAQMDRVLRAHQTIPNHGVLSLRSVEQGFPSNGMYFGNTEILREVGLCEQFKGCFYEDTEYLMNFSRMCTVPVLVFCGFSRQGHDRKKTKGLIGRNRSTFVEIFKRGHR